MSKPSIFAGAAAPFAHLLGRSKPAAVAPASAAEDEKDERKRKEGESDEDYDARMKKLDEKKEHEEEEAKKAEKEEREKEEAKATAAEGAKAERTRWTQVFASELVVGRVATACTLLSTTDMAVDQILAVLKTTPAEAKAGRLGDRMGEVRVPVIGADTPAKPGTDTPAGLAAAVIAAGRKARGEAA